MRSLVLLGVSAVTWLTLASSASAQVAELAARLPASSNVVLAVRVDQVLASPIAKTNDWKFKLAKARMDGISVVPPEAKTAVFGLTLDLDSHTQLSESVVMDLEEEPNLAGLASRLQGEVDQLGKYQAVALHGDSAYVVGFGGNRVALLAPGNRQAAVRWVTETDNRKGSGLAPFLNETLARAAAPVVLALDLENVATAKRVRAALDETPKFKSRPNLDALATAIASVRGISLEMSFGANTVGTIRVEFAQAAEFSPDDAKALLLAALGRNGVMLDELAEWEATVSGKHISLSGELTESGRRRVFSLFSPPPSLKPPAPEPKPEDMQSVVARSSQQYYQHIAALMKDLRLKKSDTDVQTMGSWAAWYESYARKIDQLPVLNVDPELVSFGGYTAQSLRNACQSLRTGAAQSRTRQVNAQPVYNTYSRDYTYGYSYRWDGMGGPVGTTSSVNVYDKYATQRQQTAIRTEERVGAFGSANEIMLKLEQDMGTMRQKMTAKYKLEF